MAHTSQGIASVLQQVWSDDTVGRYLRIPIRVSPEARARRDWADAVAWLQEREEARREWPWPGRR